MGIRSDVGLAIKHEALASLVLTEATRMLLEEQAVECLTHDEGKLYVWRNIKWYKDEYRYIKDLYRALDAIGWHDFKLVCSCSAYPDDYSEDAGHWDTNPWSLEKIVDVRLQFDTEA